MFILFFNKSYFLRMSQTDINVYRVTRQINNTDNRYHVT